MSLPKKFLLLLLSLILLSASIVCSQNPSPFMPQSPLPSSLNSDSVKILTSQEGIYRITAKELGWSETPSELRLTLHGEPHPFWIDEDGQTPTLYFYAPKVNHTYSMHNIFILTPSAGDEPSPSRTYQASGSTPRTSYTAYMHLEENTFYQPLALESPWLGQRIIAPQTLTIPIMLEEVSAGPGTLRVKLWGSTQANTQASTEPDHHIQLTLNGQLIGDQTWDGQTTQTITADIPENLLTTGENVLEIAAPGDTEAAVDIVFLDWVEVAYQREAQALGDALIFEGEGEAAPLRLAGFSAPPVVFDVTSPSASTRLVSADPAPDAPTFTGEAGHRYVAAGPGGYLSPSQISPLALTPDLKSPAPGGDYLAIGPAPLLSPLEPLLAHRRAQGLSVRAIPLEAVYDQFGDGFPHPLAIRSFLQYAVREWETAPQYVLLVGDATYDPLGYKFSTEGHLLPTFPVDTQHGGRTGSDIPLAQLDDASEDHWDASEDHWDAGEDPWPDVAIGRVPARTPEQVQIFVEKTITYENSLPSTEAGAEWSGHIFGIADGQEAAFKDDAQTFLDHFDAPYQTTLLAPEAGDTGAAGEIQAELEDGAFITAYFGHGSVRMWGKDKLFTTENAAELKNEGRLSIILNFTCLTGFFTHPTAESLAESLLWNPQGGAVAVLAPSSLTLPTNQSYLSDALAQELLSSSSSRLGDIVLQAWRQVPVDDANSLDVMQTFMLFGDPGLVVER